jgi:hypothetical protein
MTAGSYGPHAVDAQPGPSEAQLNEILCLGEQFPLHQIFWYVDSGRGVRYTAQAARIGIRPHTIITNDLAELRDALEQPIRKG